MWTNINLTNDQVAVTSHIIIYWIKCWSNKRRDNRKWVSRSYLENRTCSKNFKIEILLHKAERWDGCADCAQFAWMKSACCCCIYACQKQKVEKPPVHMMRNCVCVCMWIITWEYDDIISCLKWDNLNQSQSRRTDKLHFFIRHIVFHLTLDLMFSSIHTLMRKMITKTQLLYHIPLRNCVCEIVHPHWGTKSGQQ